MTISSSYERSIRWRCVIGGYLYGRLRRLFDGVYMGNNCYDLALADEARSKDLADLISFGRPFIANPDLVERLKAGAALSTYDQATLYGGWREGLCGLPRNGLTGRWIFERDAPSIGTTPWTKGGSQRSDGTEAGMS